MEYYIKQVGSGRYLNAPMKGTVKNKNEGFKYSEEMAQDYKETFGNALRLIEAYPKKILIIGDARHGKDCFADMICEEYDYSKESSSIAALRIFLMDVLKSKYNLSYGSKEEAYEDRINHRDKWFDEISLYNKDDKTRLAKDILKTNNIYVGMRCEEEIEQCKKDNVFDLVIGLVDYRKPSENKTSNSIDIFKNADIIVCNNGDLRNLEEKVVGLKSILT